MLIVSHDPSYWRRLGWTVPICDERLVQCRTHQKEYKEFPEHSQYSFRCMNAALYQKLKTVRSILQQG